MSASENTQVDNNRKVTFQKPMNPNTVFLKLVELNEEQKVKGFYQQLQVGEPVEGILEKVGTNKFGKAEYTLAELNSERKLVLATAGNLAFKIKDKGIKIGDAVQITYNGKNKATTGEYKGTAMHNFTVLGEA